jgi:hypothetical protein
VNNTRDLSWQSWWHHCHDAFESSKNASICPHSIMRIRLTERTLHFERSPHPSKKWQEMAVIRVFFEHSYTSVNEQDPNPDINLIPTLGTERQPSRASLLPRARDSRRRRCRREPRAHTRVRTYPHHAAHCLIYNMRRLYGLVARSTGRFPERFRIPAIRSITGQNSFPMRAPPQTKGRSAQPRRATFGSDQPLRGWHCC